MSSIKKNNNTSKMDKIKYNRIRRIIFCIVAFSMFFFDIFYIVIYSFTTIIYGNKYDNLTNIIAMICLIYMVIAALICLGIYCYKHPKYGKFTFADESKPPKKYKYENLNIIEFLKNKLIDNEFTKYDSDVDFINGEYYYKQENKKYYIVLFIEQDITKKIYKDYTTNGLCGFLDKLADNGMLDDWNKIYFSIVFKENKENTYTKEFINYNFTLPQNIGYLPILVDEKKSQIAISNFDIGYGLAEYDEMKKRLLKEIDSYLVKTKK